MEKGRYFSKPRLLSDKLQELLDGLESADNVGLLGFPKSMFTETPQEYQQYYHSTCGPSDFYLKYYGINNVKGKPAIKQQSHSNANQQSKSKERKQKQKQQKNAGKKTQRQNQKGGNDDALPAIGRCIFRVGKVLEIEDHSNADSMLVEQIDLGEESGPRTICSGIKGKVTKEEMLGSLVIVFSNLKKAKLRGIDSCGMVMCATSENGLEVLRPPEGSAIGERIVLEDEDLNQYQPTSEVKAKKKKNPWLDIKDDLKTNGECIACYKGRKLVTSKGPLRVPSLANVQIK